MDILFGISFAILYIFASFLLQFPAFRLYMGIGFAMGLIIYIKFLRIIVAFFKKMCYNGITKLVKRAKIDKKLLKREDLDI